MYLDYHKLLSPGTAWDFDGFIHNLWYHCIVTIIFCHQTQTICACYHWHHQLSETVSSMKLYPCTKMENCSCALHGMRALEGDGKVELSWYPIMHFYLVPFMSWTRSQKPKNIIFGTSIVNFTHNSWMLDNILLRDGRCPSKLLRKCLDYKYIPNVLFHICFEIMYRNVSKLNVQILNTHLKMYMPCGLLSYFCYGEVQKSQTQNVHVVWTFGKPHQNLTQCSYF